MKKAVAILCACMCVFGASFRPKATDGKAKTNEPEYVATIIYDKVWKLPYALSHNEWEEIKQVVMSEAGGEDFKGKQLIANCIINKCRLTGKTPHQVIVDDTYSHAKNYYTNEVERAVISVFENGERPFGKLVTIFYSPANMPNGTSEYHESQTYYGTHGGHKVFIENKYAEQEIKSCSTGTYWKDPIHWGAATFV